MRRIIFAVILLMAFMSVQYVKGQEISVESFHPLVNDLTANTFGTIEYDQNGDPAALIKVVIVNSGFVFDGGMTGIVKTEEHPGEIWVYVPAGLKRLTIAHPDFGLLRDYEIPVTIERARTYEMRLRVSLPERAESDIVPTVNLTFDNPADSSGVFLNGAFMGLGSWSGIVAAATYLLEVKKEGFVTYSTTVTLESDSAEQTITIPELEPVKGQIMANSNPSGAKVYMDGILLGRSPVLIENLEAGTYTFDFRQRGYKPYTSVVNVKSEETYKADATLKRVNNSVYAGAGYQVGHISGLTAFAGIYLENINLEIGYLSHSVQKEQTYWLLNSEVLPNSTTQISSLVLYDFSLNDVFSVSLGYGKPIGKRFCVTPGLGASIYSIDGTCTYIDSFIDNTVAAEDFRNVSTYTISAMLRAKIEFIPIKYVSIVVSPAFEFPAVKGSLASILDNGSDIIQKWCGGFSVIGGIKFYY